MRILIIEDNQRLGELIVQGLSARGFSCDVASTLAAGEEALRAAAFDLVILDVGLPDGDGLAWLAKRPRAEQPPTLVLTARDSVADRIRGLDAGADDYLPKPFALDELAARIRAVLRRPGARRQAIVEVGGLSFDPASCAAYVNDVRLDLARRELHLFELLLRHAGQIIQRGQIEESLYTFDEPVTPNAIEAVVSRLRRKLEDAGAGSRLHTMRGLGYVLSETP